MSHKTYAYIRVSSKDQNEDRQILAIKGFQIPCQNIFIDKQSGKDFDRPAYIQMLKKIKRGDLLIIKSIDRLGRNYEEIIKQWSLITKDKCADIIVIDMPLLDTTKGKDLLGTFISDLVLQLLSFVAENERANIRQRQKEGIYAAKLKGVQFGRKFKDFNCDFSEIINRWKSKEITRREAIALSGMSESTFYRRLSTREREEDCATGSA